MTAKDTTGIGNAAELQALKFLEKQGLNFVEANYHCKAGEIDLILRDKEALVFVEVRFRKSSLFGGALESINTSKQNKVRRSAEYWLQEKKLLEKVAVRFDVIALSNQDCQWIQNAF